MSTYRLFAWLATVASLSFTPGLRAQAVIAKSPTPTDEVTTLSEFNVSAVNDNGYMPAESTSGSRVAVKITDLPYAVNIVTSEFLKDFNIFDLSEEMAFTSSVSGLDQGGNFSVRGFGGNIVLRNGFSRLGNFDRTSSDRIEFIKGPAAAIYGQTNPGGIVNFITKQPKTTPRQSVMFAAGSYDTTREEIESSGPIPLGQGAPKLFYVVNGSYFHRTYESPSQATRTRSAYLGLVYKFSKTTSLNFDFDYVWQHNDTVQIPEEFDPTQPTNGPRRFFRLATELAHLNYANPTDWNERTVFTYDLFFEHRFNSILSMRTAASVYRSPRWSYSSGALSQYNGVTRTLTRSQKPTFGFLQGDGQSGAVDLVASYNAGKTRNKTLLTVDYFNNVGKRPTYTAKNNLGPATVGVDSVTPIPYVNFSLAGLGTDYVVSRFRDDYARTVGTFLRHQLWAFDDRFVAMAGMRYDHVQNFAHDDLTLYPAGSPFAGQHVHDGRWTAHNISTTAGFNFHVTPGVIYYASRSESFVPGGPSGIDLSKTPLVIVPNQTGLGYETGFKFDTLDHRFSLTTSVYDIALKNVQTSDIDPANPLGPLITTYEGGQKARGFEADGNWRITNSLNWLLGYGYTHSRLTDRGVDLDIMSRQASKIPYHQLGSAVRYEIAKGLSAYVSMRYLSSTFVDTGGSVANATTRIIAVGSNNGQRLLRSPAYAVWNVGSAYKFKTDHGIGQSINVTVKNVFDKFYVQPSRNLGDRLGGYVSYSLNH